MKKGLSANTQQNYLNGTMLDYTETEHLIWIAIQWKMLQMTFLEKRKNSISVIGSLEPFCPILLSLWCILLENSIFNTLSLL